MNLLRFNLGQTRGCRIAFVLGEQMFGEHGVAFGDEFLKASADAALNEIEFMFALAHNFREKRLKRLFNQESPCARILARHVG